MVSREQIFDPAKVDHAATVKVQKERRKELMKWSAVPVVLAVMLALWCILPSQLTSFAIKNYNQQHYQKSRDWLTPLTWTSPEQFVIAFNSGTADSQRKQYTQSEAELTRALALAPASMRCMVLQNLVLTLNAHAKGLQSQGGDAATPYTVRSTTLVKANSQCFTGNKGQQGNGGGGGGSSTGATGAATSNSDAPTPAQLNALQQKEDQGQQQLQQQADQDTLNASDPHIKQW